MKILFIILCIIFSPMSLSQLGPGAGSQGPAARSSSGAAPSSERTAPKMNDLDKDRKFHEKEKKVKGSARPRKRRLQTSPTP